jgi:hypothetical protein
MRQLPRPLHSCALGIRAGMQKLGGQPLSTTAQLQDCIAHARLRHREVAHILQQQLEAAAGAAAPGAGSVI